MDKPCDICGHVGFEDLIATCSRCSLAREHVYCMRNNCKKIPDIWFCETCVLKRESGGPQFVKKEEFAKATRNFNGNSGKQYHNQMLRKVEGKVKFISPKEAAMLSSREGKDEFPLKSSVIKRHCQLNIPAYAVPKRTTSKLLLPKVEENSSVRPAGSFKSPRHDSVQLQPMPKSNKPLGGSFCPELKVTNIVEKLPNDMPMEEKVGNPPGVAIWRGSFINNDKIYGTFQAHPPVAVSWKAYEFSKQLPVLLKFKLIPRSDLWEDVFKDLCPNEYDIALYIFPGDLEREKSNYFCLVEEMEMHDLVMVSCINGIEWLIFSSKVLEADIQGINMKNFMWGIFRSAKAKKAVNKEDRLIRCNSIKDGNEVSDLETGKNAVRVDSVWIKPERTWGSNCA